MKVTEFTRNVLAYRRQDRAMKALGYVERTLLVPSGLKIADVKPALRSNCVWVKLERETYDRPLSAIIPGTTRTEAPLGLPT